MGRAAATGPFACALAAPAPLRPAGATFSLLVALAPSCRGVGAWRPRVRVNQVTVNFEPPFLASKPAPATPSPVVTILFPASGAPGALASWRPSHIVQPVLQPGCLVRLHLRRGTGRGRPASPPLATHQRGRL